MRTKVFALLAAASAALAAPSAASAATIIGTLPGVLFNVTSSTAVIGSGSTFTNGFSLISGTGTGDLGGITAGTPVSVSTILATVGQTITLNSTFGSFTGKISTVNAASSALSSVVALYTLGTFTPSASLPGFSAGAASLTFTFNQTGPAGSAVSGSYTLASPPSGVPEPAAWGMLIAGAGMAGAAVRRRRSVKITYA